VSALLEPLFEDIAEVVAEKSAAATLATRIKEKVMMANAMASFFGCVPDADTRLGVRFQQLKTDLEQQGKLVLTKLFNLTLRQRDKTF